MKLLKISALISIIVVSLAIRYYYFNYLPNKNTNEQNTEKAQQEFENNKQCAEIGRSFYEKEVALTQNNSSSIGQYFEPEFRYNSKLNTCLYLGHTIHDDVTIKGAVYGSDYIRDLNSNKIITEWSRSMKDGKIVGSFSVGSQSEFNKAKEDLGFSELWE